MSYNLAYSTDAITWQTGVVNPTLENFSKISSGFNRLVAVSEKTFNRFNLPFFTDQTSNVYSLSSNGTTWNSPFYIGDSFTNPNTKINDLIFIENKFISVPDRNSPLVSNLKSGVLGIGATNTNIINWSNLSQFFVTDKWPRVMTYGTGVGGTGYFVADRSSFNSESFANIGPFYNYKYDIISISTNGINWGPPFSGLNITQEALSAVKAHKFLYGNNKFITVFENAPYINSEGPYLTGFHKIGYSTDPRYWYESNPLPIPVSFSIKGAVIAQNNVFIIAGILDSFGSPINSGLYSTDAINWSLVEFPNIVQNWNIGTYGNNKFVLLSSNSNSIITSTNGINWSLSNPFTLNRNWSDITYAYNKFIAISKDTIGPISSSSSSSDVFSQYIRNSISWPNHPSCPLKTIYADNHWVNLINQYNVNSTYGTLLVSTDRTNWVTKNLPLDVNVNFNNRRFINLSDIDYGNNKWIISSNINTEGQGRVTGYCRFLTGANSTGTWGEQDIFIAGSSNLLDGYSWSQIKYGGNKWVLAGTRVGPPSDIDGYIQFIYQRFYRRVATTSEISSHKQSLGSFSTFDNTQKARLIMNIMGFDFNGTISNFNCDYTSHANPIVRTFERLRNYGIPNLTRAKYYEILDTARLNNTSAPSIDNLYGWLCSFYNVCNPSASNVWNLTKGVIEAIHNLAFSLVPSQNLQPSCSTPICTCNTAEGGIATFANCWLREQMWPLINVFETTDGYSIPFWVNEHFPNHTYGAIFTAFHQYASVGAYRRPTIVCHNNYTVGCGYNTIRNFEHRMGTAFLRLILLDQWHTNLNNVNPISQSEVVSILNQFDNGSNNINYNAIYYSNDNGINWNISNCFNENKPFNHLQYAFGRFFAGVNRDPNILNDNIDGYISTDGIQWLPGGFPRLLFSNSFPSDFDNTYNKQFVSSDYNSNGTIMVTSQSNKLYISTNSGLSFTDISNNISNIISTNSRLKNISYFGGSIWGASEEKIDNFNIFSPSKLHISTNNGQTWSSELVPETMYSEYNLPLISNKSGLGIIGGCNFIGLINVFNPPEILNCNFVVWNIVGDTREFNTPCLNIKDICFSNQISEHINCLSGPPPPPPARAGVIYMTFEKYVGGGLELVEDEPHVRISNGQFYYQVPKTFYKFIDIMSGYGNNTHSVRGFGSGYIDNPTGFQPAISYITGIVTGETNDLGEIVIDNIKINELSPIVTPVISEDGFSLTFDIEEFPCTGDCIKNKLDTTQIYLDYPTGFISATGSFEINFNKLTQGDSIFIGSSGFYFSSEPAGPDIFTGFNNLIQNINSSEEVYVDYINNNKVFLKSKLPGESGNNIILDRRSIDPLAIIINNRYLGGGKHLRISSNVWDGFFEMENSDIYTFYNSGYYDRLYQITGEEILTSTVQDVIWEDSFKNTWSIITGLNEDGGVNRMTGVVNFNDNLNVFYGTGVIPSGRGEFLEYTGLNLLITKENPYNLTGYIVEYIISGNNFIFSGLLK